MITGILGGGLCGTTLQRFLTNESVILEKENKIGGLCRSFEKNGFTYDIGGHILFSKNDSFIDFITSVLSENVNIKTRNNKILYNKKFVKYPFENGLHALEKEEIFECLYKYLNNQNPSPTNFLEWIYHIFGDAIANKYLVPYNQKIWKTPLNQMSTEWVERIPKPPLEDLLKSALGIETQGYTHQLSFYYPNHGGIESLIKSIVKINSQIITNYEVSSIKKVQVSDNKFLWKISNGQTENNYDRLVISMPLKQAIKSLENVPPKVLTAVDELRQNAVRIVMIGINNDSLMDKSAIYIPSPEILAHRVCFMGYFSQNNVPNGKSSLIAEITCPVGSQLYNLSDSLLIERVVTDMEKLGLINKSDIIVTDTATFDDGYIVYDHQHQRNIKFIKSYFENIEIHLLGRFAEFDYINMDEAVLRSIALANKLNQEDNNNIQKDLFPELDLQLC